MDSRRLLRNLAFLVGGCALALSAAPAARAVVFTVDATYSFSLTNGAIGDILPASLLFTTGDFLIEDPNGGVDPATDDIFLAIVTLGGGSASVDEIQIAVGTDFFFNGPKAAASLDDAGIAPSAVTADSTSTLTGIFEFSPNLAANETTVRLLVAYDVPGEMQIGDTANFMISTGAGDVTVPTTIVPEPGTALLLACGLVGLAAAGRNRTGV